VKEMPFFSFHRWRK